MNLKKSLIYEESSITANINFRTSGRNEIYKNLKIEIMEKYIYRGVEIEYSGFKIEDSFCFYGYFENKLLYLTQTQLDNLIKIN